MISINAFILSYLWLCSNLFSPCLVFVPYAIGTFFLILFFLFILAKDEKVENWFIESPVRFYLVGFIACLFVVGFLDAFYIFDIDNGRYPFGNEWDNIIVESHGLLFDLFVLGILLAIYDQIKEKRRIEEEKQQTIKRYLEELEDFRYWKSEEAKFRIQGIVRRLVSLDFTKIDFTYLDLSCVIMPNIHLFGASLLETDFSGANLTGTSFEYAKINSTKFKTRDTQLLNAKFMDTNIYATDFEGAFLMGSDFSRANISKSSFRNSDLRGVTFLDANFFDCEFAGAEVNPNFIEQAEAWNLRGQSITDIYEIISIEAKRFPGKFAYFLKKKSE